MFVGATVLQAGANGALAASAGLLGQALVGRQFVASAPLVDSPRLLFSPLVLCLVGVGAALVKTASGAAGTYTQKRMALRAGDVLRRQIAAAILDGGQTAGSPTEAHAKIAVRLREVERGVDDGLLAGARAATCLVPLAATLFALSARMAFGALALLMVFAFLLSQTRRQLKRGHTRAARLAERLHENLDELVRHLDLWRTYGAEARIRAALEASGEQAGRAVARAETGRALLSGGNEVAAALALLAVVGVAERGGLVLGDGPLVAFAAVFFLMYRPLRDLGDARTLVERGAHALAELDEVRTGTLGATALHSEVRSERTVAPGWAPATLAVRGVAVVHGGRATPPTTLDARPGEIVAVVGATGAGKTSLLRALLGLDREVLGEIRYGDRDLTRAGVGPRERPFAWVPQEPAIVSGSLASNVALGAPGGETDAQVEQALATIGASSLLGRELDALSAGGPELSGGERQWVAIARALSTGLPVLLLDEPTAGLDARSQERVLSALEALRGKRTVVLVTHRPEPLALADLVVTLEHRPPTTP
jgi:ABC-type multidrug transport system fused ATPase/permease subunit